MFEVAAYRLDAMLGLGMVPVTVERSHSGKRGSLVWWVDDVLMDEGQRSRGGVNPPDASRWQTQMNGVRIFDQLISNLNRNPGNLLIDQDWNLWMIDHVRCFAVRRDLPHPHNLVHCSRELLDQMKALTAARIQREMGDYLLGPEIAALLVRRDRIVEYFEGKHAGT
jgi:hypothetical protein